MLTDSPVVVPWDFSEHSKIALAYALKLSAARNIHVICVLERPDLYTTGTDFGEDVEKRAAAKCLQQFWSTNEKLKQPGLKFVAEFGDAATEIVRFAKSLQAEVIVISSHGRTGIQRVLLGSVAQKVCQQSSCPLLMLPMSWLEIKSENADTGTQSLACD